MTRDSSKAGTDARQPAVDFAFLATQTVGEAAIERELLVLFLDQGRRTLDLMAGSTGRQRSEMAHLLRGSSLGIGAWAMAAAAADLEAAAADDQTPRLARLADAFAAAEAAIRARLASL